MTAADFARQSDPECNFHFRRGRSWGVQDRQPGAKPRCTPARTLDHIAAEIMTCWRSGAEVV